MFENSYMRTAEALKRREYAVVASFSRYVDLVRERYQADPLRAKQEALEALVRTGVIYDTVRLRV